MACKSETENLSLYQILERIARATAAFLDSESDLLASDVNERSLTHQLAVHLGIAFERWDVDCEYNRIGDLVKKVPPLQDCKIDPADTDAVTIYPDIIIHCRNTPDNCAVIEVKKRTNKKTRNLDRHKLSVLTEDSQFLYRVGLLMEIDAENGTVSDIEVFRDGVPDDTLTQRAASLIVRRRRRPREERDFNPGLDDWD